MTLTFLQLLSPPISMRIVSIIYFIRFSIISHFVIFLFILSFVHTNKIELEFGCNLILNLTRLIQSRTRAKRVFKKLFLDS